MVWIYTLVLAGLQTLVWSRSKWKSSSEPQFIFLVDLACAAWALFTLPRDKGKEGVGLFPLRARVSAFCSFFLLPLSGRGNCWKSKSGQAKGQALVGLTNFHQVRHSFWKTPSIQAVDTLRNGGLCFLNLGEVLNVWAAFCLWSGRVCYVREQCSSWIHSFSCPCF